MLLSWHFDTLLKRQVWLLFKDCSIVDHLVTHGLIQVLHIVTYLINM